MRSLPQILLVDDDNEIGVLVKKILGPFVEIDFADNVRVAREFFKAKPYDLALIDLQISEDNGLDLIKEFRQSFPDGKCRFLLITGKGTVEDQIRGHELGIAEYMAKPFQPKLFEVIIKKHLLETFSAQSDAIVRGALKVNMTKFTADVIENNETKRLELTPKEFRILTFLLQNEGKVLSREQIYEHIWEESSDSLHRTVDMHVSSLRKKLDICSHFIKTIRSVGYMFEVS